MQCKSLTLLLVSGPVLAQAGMTGMAECVAIGDDHARLVCFDRLAARQAGAASNDVASPVAVPSDASATATARAPAATAANTASVLDASPLPQRVPPVRHGTSSLLSKHWELAPQDKRGRFAFRSHRANFLMATYTSTPNDAPYQPLRPVLPGSGELSRAELSYQLGFKMKFLEEPFGTPFDFWAAYTQRSFWQAANRQASSPFRETNYQPELMAVMPLDLNVLGLKLRFVNVGVLHQSNGQASSLSRSWNRVYAQLGIERGRFTLLARTWRRLAEEAVEDDNPDIVDYMGHGDLEASYHWRGHDFTALLRHNRNTGKGARQLAWSFPIANRLKGYVQYFNGYGQSLIDYNHTLNSVGIGLLVTY